MKRTPPSQARPIADRFWEKVDRRGPDECWPWLGTKLEKGYGQVWYERRHRPATHISLMLDGRPVAPGRVAMHSCDNPPCVNPRHLIVGSTADNAADAVAKGRTSHWWRERPDRVPRGSAHGRTHLVEEDIVEIRRAHAFGHTLEELARRYAVSPTAVGSIVKRRSWKHVP